MKIGDDSAEIIIFASPSGGYGASVMAAFCAVYYAAQQQKTLYLNLESFDSSETIFLRKGSLI